MIVHFILFITSGQVSKKYGSGREILIHLTDLPSNDFKSVWKNIHGEQLLFPLKSI